MAAADGTKKERTEWPPHPERVFMALAAAWFETGQDEREGEALRWLEAQPSPPDIAASGAEPRRIVTSYVPVNDTAMAGRRKLDELRIKPDATLSELKDAGLDLLAEFRSRQGRSFPVAIPHSPVVHLIWGNDLPDIHRESLASLCRKVTSVGHSASLVQMWLEDNPPSASLVPVEGLALHRLRVTGEGRLDYLERRYNRNAVVAWADLNARIQAAASGKEKKVLQAQLQEHFPGGRPTSLHPDPGRWQGYDIPRPAPARQPPGSIFDPRLIMLKLSGQRLSLPATLKLTEALRGALLADCTAPIPEWLSGHAKNGGRSNKPHVALLPLPFVGAQHADGRLMGVALALPRDLDAGEAARVLEPRLRREEDWLPRAIKIFDGQWLECTAELDTRESPPWNLRPETWTGPTRHWASVTPVVLDRHFDGTDKWEKAAKIVKDACIRAGLPRPLDVLLRPVSMFEGVSRSNEFPWLTRKKDGGRMHHAHAVIVFDEDVQGPVVVG
ncbi:MAG: type I-G CRISPR-associated protein Csb2, partial [Candidatus Entotheonellia bacterium]